MPLEGEAGEAQPEGRRLGVDPVSATHAERLPVLERPGDEGVAVCLAPATTMAPASRSCSARAVSSTSDEVRP